MDLGFLSGPLGAIFGGVGAVAGKVIELKMKDKELEAKKLDHAHSLELRKWDLEQVKLEMSGKMEIAKVDADSAQAVADLNNLAVSYGADKAAYGDHTLGRVADFVRGLTRPVITVVSMALLVYMTVRSFALGAEMTPSQAAELLNNAQFIAGTAITWWFGTRYTSKRK